jgi:transcriptional regulator with XRE-family HTH domain
MLTKSHIHSLRKSDPGRRIGKAIELAGLTQREVARGVEVTESYISDLVRGTRGNPNLKTLHKFQHFFQCPIEVLFPSDEERQQPRPYSHEEYSQKASQGLAEVLDYESDADADAD